ncbi:MAG: MATE family efflux transporter [Ruminiclostridium sp.]|nr:MATE family efflux transporter [Ruminiclostridium sp.]
MGNYTKTMNEGSEFKHIILFTLPLLFGNLFQQFYNIVDSVIVGRYLGSNALAAVGATGSITYLFYTLCIGLSIGTGILIAQHFGAGGEENVKKLIVNSAYVITAFGVVLTALSIMFAPDLLRLLATDEVIFDDAVRYMRIACAGTLAVAAFNWINGVMRSLGNSTIPLVFLIIACVLNIGLDLLFVLVFDMGVAGAAYATIIAQAVSAAGCIVFAFAKFPQFRISRELRRFDPKTARNCISKGVPIALQNAFISFSMIYLQRTANTFGVTITATYTATMRVEQLIQQPFISLSTAVSTFTGQNLGAGRLDRCIRGYRRSMIAMAGFAVLMLGVFMLFSGNIVGFFVEEPEVIATGDTALKLSACFYLFLGTIHVTRGLLNGAGDVNYAMVNGFVEVIGRIGFATVLSLIPEIGCWAVWATSGLTWFITGLMSLIRYKRGRWKGHGIQKSDVRTQE